MKEEQVKKISLSTFFLILAIIAICILCYFLYNMTLEANKMLSNETELNSKISKLEKQLNTNHTQISTEQTTNSISSNEFNSISSNTATNSSTTTNNISFTSLSGIYVGNADITPGTTPNGEKEISLYLYENGSFRYYDSPGLDSGHVGYYTFNNNNLILHEILECANDIGRTITNNTITLEINADNSITDNSLNAILKKSSEKIEENSNIINIDLKNALENNALR